MGEKASAAYKLTVPHIYILEDLYTEQLMASAVDEVDCYGHARASLV